MKFRIITLCGSTKFKDQFIAEQKRLTMEGNIVISVGLFGHSGDNEVWKDGTKEMLDLMHKRKIDLADEIFVINVDDYIGPSTRNEIEYAIKIGKAVTYMENHKMSNLTEPVRYGPSEHNPPKKEFHFEGHSGYIATDENTIMVPFQSDSAHAAELKEHVLKFSIWAHTNNQIHLVDAESDTWVDVDGYLFTFDELYTEYLNQK